jgi:hypothetical protein
MTVAELEDAKQNILHEDVVQQRVHVLLYPWQELEKKYGTTEGGHLVHPTYNIAKHHYNTILRKGTVGELNTRVSRTSRPSVRIYGTGLYVPIKFVRAIFCISDKNPSLRKSLQKVVDYV